MVGFSGGNRVAPRKDVVALQFWCHFRRRKEPWIRRGPRRHPNPDNGKRIKFRPAAERPRHRHNLTPTRPEPASRGGLADDVSTIGAVARNGPPDDFNNQPTQHADYGVSGRPPVGGPSPSTSPPAEAPADDEQPESLDPLDQETEPTPWYRKPVVLTAWALAVLILIALIVYGILELIHGGQGTSHTPSTTSSTPTTTTSTTTAAPTPTTTEPPTSSAVEPPQQQPTYQPTHQPTQQQPTHRHHLPPLPSVITIPEVPTVITLPPGLP
jgi:hypothetical protein